MSAETYRQRTLERVKALVLTAVAGHDVRVYLFGSSASGTARRPSDVDVAVEPREPLPSGLLPELRLALEESTIPYIVDVVDLSGASLEFRERVRQEGILWRD